MHRKRYHDFLSKFFCRSVSKVIVGFFLCLRVIMVQKNLNINGEFRYFLSKNFCVTMSKIFIGNPSVFQNVLGIEKVLHKRGIPGFYVERCLSHRTECIRLGTLLCIGVFLVSKKLVHKRWKSRISVE